MATEARPCPVCLQTGERRHLFRQSFLANLLGENYDVALCSCCGAAFADNIASQQVYEEYYADHTKYDYKHNNGIESTYDFLRFNQIADELEGLGGGKNVSVLDIGCATGGLLNVLKNRGFTRLAGCDPAAECVSAAKSLYGIEVFRATLSELRSHDARFDRILMIGVLEHVRELREALATARDLLSPDGIVFCAQPNIAQFAECRNAPFQQFSPEHINYFSSQSLRRAAAEEGLDVTSSKEWMVEWREGVWDSVLSVALNRAGEQMGQPHDYISQPALERYIEKCSSEERLVGEKIDKLTLSAQPIYIWGTGAFVQRLLKTTKLGSANIRAFIDSSARDQKFAERPLILPQSIPKGSIPIAIGSVTFYHEIASTIRELNLPNPIIKLYGSIGGD